MPLEASAAANDASDGFLSGATFETMREYVVAFHRGFGDAGFVEGRNLAVEYRWRRVTTIGCLHWPDLVRRGVVIVVVGASTPGALAAKTVTQTIPIVFLSVPTQSKLASSIASHDRAATSQALRSLP
jgi:hypothetical protein